MSVGQIGAAFLGTAYVLALGGLVVGAVSLAVDFYRRGWMELVVGWAVLGVAVLCLGAGFPLFAYGLFSK